MLNNKILCQTRLIGLTQSYIFFYQLYKLKCQLYELKDQFKDLKNQFLGFEIDILSHRI